MNEQPIYHTTSAPGPEDIPATFRETVSEPLTGVAAAPATINRHNEYRNGPKNITPYDLTALRRIAEAQSGSIGFLTDEQRAQMPHIVRLAGLTRTALGDARFARIYGLCKHSAELIAPRAFWAEAVVENHARVGYEFGFSDKLAALRFALCHEAAMRGKPLPLARTVAAQ